MVSVERPLRPCATPGCPVRVTSGRCPRCITRRRHPSNARRQTWSAVYGPDWPSRRLDYLIRHPVCILCGHMATVPDHHPRGIHLLRRQGILDPHQDKYLRPLCEPCHAVETAKHHPGGWAAQQAR